MRNIFVRTSSWIALSAWGFLAMTVCAAQGLIHQVRWAAGRSSLTIIITLSILSLYCGPFISRAEAPTITVAAPSFLDESDEPAADQLLHKPRLTFAAVITQYSRKDSCHNRRKGKCIMASGKAVYVGAVACPYSLALGSKVVVNGTEYTCEDRYARWLDRQRGLPTIDVFVENNPRGNDVMIVSVQ